MRVAGWFLLSAALFPVSAHFASGEAWECAAEADAPTTGTGGARAECVATSKPSRLHRCLSSKGVIVTRSYPCPDQELALSSAETSSLQNKICQFYKECRSSTIKGRVKNGVLFIPVVVADRFVMEFVVDTGASSLVVNKSLYDQLRSKNLISLPVRTVRSTIADGSSSQQGVAILKVFQIGNSRFNDVEVLVGEAQSPLLMGGAILKRLQDPVVDVHKQEFRFK